MSHRDRESEQGQSARNLLSVEEAECRSRSATPPHRPIASPPLHHPIEDPMTALPALTRNAVSPDRKAPFPATAPDAQMRAAEIMGRIVHLFDAFASCSPQGLEEARGLLVDELAHARSRGSRSPHESRRRSAVLTAALECVHVASEGRSGSPAVGLTDGSGGGAPSRTDSEGAPSEAERVVYRVHCVLDGVTALHDPATSSRRPRGVDVLAHMLRGPEPRSWSRDQQEFARCALEWMKVRADEPSPGSPRDRGRWSTSARRDAGMRPGRRDSTGRLLSA